MEFTNNIKYHPPACKTSSRYTWIELKEDRLSQVRQEAMPNLGFVVEFV